MSIISMMTASEKWKPSEMISINEEERRKKQRQHIKYTNQK